MNAPLPASPRPTRVYVPAVGPKLRWLLRVIFCLAAILGANSLYLAAITFMEWLGQQRGQTVILQNYFYQLMFLLHLVLGVLFSIPLLIFCFCHLWQARSRPNKPAVRMGLLLFAACLVLLASGFVLMRLEGVLNVTHPTVRQVAYWAHVLSPLAAIWLYVLHRLAGPVIRWKLALVYGGAVTATVAAMTFMHSHDPRQWNVVGPKEGVQYFEPSLARTANGKFIPREALQMDEYCMQCHKDAYDGHIHSAHHFSSFNNKAYLFSVRELRRRKLASNGTVKPSRWCAGCHDPVPFFSGAFDNPKFDDEKDPTAHAGITCTVCHSITNINSTKGNADYTIEEAQHYPFAFSDNRWLQFLNRSLIRAKPAMHKKTFLKPLHKTAEFCSTCHKVHIPREVTDYKDFLRGQNHYDSFLLSGVSGHGARSFYYPPKAQENCNGCHMPLQESSDFGARLFPGAERPSIHNHLFVGANTAVAHWDNSPETIAAHQKFLRGCVRVDVFGLKEGLAITAPVVPLRPELPVLQPGKSYLLAVVIRTLRVGHHFTQGTVDSNQAWVEVTAKAGGKLLGANGSVDESGKVDPWANFLNVYMLDRTGKRIDRRNVQDIFTPFYDHQIPPGAAQVAHYRLDVPEGLIGPIEIEAKVHYRKFDDTYMKYVFGEQYRIDLPISTLAEDRVTLPVAGGPMVSVEQKPPAELWERWNDYGIGLFLSGSTRGDAGEYKLAAEAFQQVEALGRGEGALNLARTAHRQGQLDVAAAALRRAAATQPAWSVQWFTGLIHEEWGDFAAAERSFLSILTLHETDSQVRARGFDFSKDYVVLNALGRVRFAWSRRELARGNQERRDELLRRAAEAFQLTLQIDSENLDAHSALFNIYDELGDRARSEEHRLLRERYRPDDTAQGLAVDLARRRDAAGNRASENQPIFRLLPPGGSPTDP